MGRTQRKRIPVSDDINAKASRDKKYTANYARGGWNGCSTKTDKGIVLCVTMNPLPST